MTDVSVSGKIQENMPVTGKITEDISIVKTLDEIFTPSILVNNLSTIFDGVDENININSVSSAIASTVKGTWSLWTKNNGGGAAMGVGDNTNTGQILIQILGSNIIRGFCATNSAMRWDLRTTSGHGINTWINTILIQDGISPVLIVDGILVDQSFIIESDKTVWANGITINNGRIGSNARSSTSFFTGNLDEVSFWNTNLSLTEAQEIYNSGNPTNLLTHSKNANLVSWFRMGDDDTFPTITDNKGSNDGTMINMSPTNFVLDVPPSPAFINDISTIFDGVDDFAETSGDVPALNSVTRMTWSIWFKYTSLAINQAILVKWDFPTQGGWSIQSGNAASDELIIIIAEILGSSGSMNYTTNSANLTTDVWNNLIVVYDGNIAAADRIKPFINGVFQAGTINGIIPTSLTNGSASVKVGKFGGILDRNLSGNVDEVGIFPNVAFDQTEVDETYNSGVPTDLTLHSQSAKLNNFWRMGDGDTFPTITDVQGNNDLTMVNMAANDFVNDTP